MPTIEKSTTEKAERKAAAVQGDDTRVFTETKYGRTRVAALPIRIILFVLVAPFVILYGAVREAITGGTRSVK